MIAENRINSAAGGEGFSPRIFDEAWYGMFIKELQKKRRHEELR